MQLIAPGLASCHRLLSYLRAGHGDGAAPQTEPASESRRARGGWPPGIPAAGKGHRAAAGRRRAA